MTTAPSQETRIVSDTQGAGLVKAYYNCSIEKLGEVALLVTDPTNRHVKRIFFTQSWFEPNIFYPKKCVNFDKSNSQQNSVKGPKDPNSAKKGQKVT